MTRPMTATHERRRKAGEQLSPLASKSQVGCISQCTTKGKLKTGCSLECSRSKLNLIVRCRAILFLNKGRLPLRKYKNKNKNKIPFSKGIRVTQVVATITGGKLRVASRPAAAPVPPSHLQSRKHPMRVARCFEVGRRTVRTLRQVVQCANVLHRPVCNTAADVGTCVCGELHFSED